MKIVYLDEIMWPASRVSIDMLLALFSLTGGSIGVYREGQPCYFPPRYIVTNNAGNYLYGMWRIEQNAKDFIKWRQFVDG